jgi:hypothetical protein
VGASPLEAHRGGIRIRGADFEVRRSLVETMNLPLLPTFLLDPIVPSCILARQFLLHCFREDDGQWKRYGTDGGCSGICPDPAKTSLTHTCCNEWTKNRVLALVRQSEWRIEPFEMAIFSPMIR